MAADLGSADGQCRQIYSQAIDNLNRLRAPEEKQSPKKQGIELLNRAGDICLAEAEAAAEPHRAAELAAIAYKSRSRLVVYTKDGDRRAILKEAIDFIAGFEHDRSPALPEILKELAYLEWTEDRPYSVKLMERAIDIHRTHFGPHDPRVAEKISQLGFLYAPSHLPRSDPGTRKDLRQAESLYREALEIHLKAKSTESHPNFRKTMELLQELLIGTERAEEAMGLKRLLDGEQSPAGP